MLTFRKGNSVKIVSPESSLIELLKHEGWKADGEKEYVAEVVNAPVRAKPPKPIIEETAE